jgi:hypothetical protein
MAFVLFLIMGQRDCDDRSRQCSWERSVIRAVYSVRRGENMCLSSLLVLDRLIDVIVPWMVVVSLRRLLISCLASGNVLTGAHCRVLISTPMASSRSTR